MSNELRFDGRVAVVTGAGRGLGRAHAMLLAARGAQVVVNDLGGGPDGQGASSDPAASVVEEIEKSGGSAVADTHDVVRDGEAVVETALSKWGKVDIVVNNAGCAGGGLFHDMPKETYDTVSRSHYDGTVNVTRRAWREMATAGYGRVVITSSSSVFGMPFTSPYVASKGALFSLGRGLAKEGAHFGIKVNTLMPVAYSRLTAMQPQEKLVAWLEENFQPERCAPFVGVLAHESVPCTGETFVGGGGRMARVIIAEGRGFEGADSPEDYLDNWDRVMSLDDLTVLEDTHQNLLISAGYMGADLEIA